MKKQGITMYNEKEYQEPVPGKWDDPAESSVTLSVRIALVLTGVVLLGAIAYLAGSEWNEPGLIRRGAIACVAVAVFIVNDVFMGPRWIFFISGAGIVLLGLSFIIW